MWILGTTNEAVASRLAFFRDVVGVPLQSFPLSFCIILLKRL